ncbi:MAG: response regulator [Desulfobacteraceae bacterium]|nr:response regulator [Desulfobacteraceae bacterium]
MSEAIKTILIVDDETFVRQSLSDYFEDNLFRVLQAESGEKALKILENETPDGAVVDVRMGGMDGHTFIRKASIKSPDTAFVICTGSPDYLIPPDLQKLTCLSAHLFKKPVINMNSLKEELLCIIEILNCKREENE